MEPYHCMKLLRLRWLALPVVLWFWLFSAPTALAQNQELPSQQSEHAPLPVHGAQAEPYRVFLPLVVQSELLDSFTLIEEALASGAIDDETALIYRTFATFGDPRLPARFQGDNSGVLESDAVAEATARFDTLSQAARTTLLPFLLPPVYKGSWYDLRMNGDRLAAADGVQGGAGAAAPEIKIGDFCAEELEGVLAPLESAHFVVWYPTVDASYRITATQFISDLETRIYPVLTQRLRTPLDDEGSGCNPDDGRLDVYLTHHAALEDSATLAYVTPYAGCRGAPTYMVVLQPHRMNVALLAHEFMHMIQYAYRPPDRCLTGDDVWWWLEASAHWAVDYFESVDPQADTNVEHTYIRSFLNKAHLALRSTAGSRQYGAYLWPFYLTHHQAGGSPEWMANFYTAIEQEGTGKFYDVMNRMIQGGFEERWPEFSLFNLNLPPVNSYERWDAIQRRWGQWRPAFPERTIALIEGPTHGYYLGFGDPGADHLIADLGIQYAGFKIDDGVRLLAFANTFVDQPHIRVQALLKRKGGDWQPAQDWSERKWTVLCRDLPDERFEEVILIISNSKWNGSEYSNLHSAGLPYFFASDLACAGWQGTADWQIRGFAEDEKSRVDYTIEGSAHPAFELASRTVVSDELQLQFKLQAGSGSWSNTVDGRNHVTGQILSCERTGSQSLAADQGGLWIVESLDPLRFTRRFFGGGIAPVGAPGLCPGLGSWAAVPWLQTGDDLRPWVGTAGGRLRGDSSETTSGDGYGHTAFSSWALEAPEPEVVRTMLAVASGELQEEELAAWVRTHSQLISLPSD
jgi:hypothetical protein